MYRMIVALFLKRRGDSWRFLGFNVSCVVVSKNNNNIQ